MKIQKSLYFVLSLIIITALITIFIIIISQVNPFNHKKTFKDCFINECNRVFGNITPTAEYTPDIYSFGARYEVSNEAWALIKTKLDNYTEKLNYFSTFESARELFNAIDTLFESNEKKALNDYYISSGPIQISGKSQYYNYKIATYDSESGKTIFIYYMIYPDNIN